MLSTKEKNPLSGLTPEEQKKLSRKEAKRFDKQRFSGGESELSEEELEKQEEKEKNIKIGEDRAKEDRLNKVKDFDTDPIGYLKMKLGEGNYEGRDKQYNYLLLLTLVKIQLALESPDLTRLTGK